MSRVNYALVCVSRVNCRLVCVSRVNCVYICLSSDVRQSRDAV